MPDGQHQPSLSVVIPCYNEAWNLERGVLDEVAHYLAGKSYTWEVILVDDGSADHSPALLRDHVRNNARFALIEIAHGGKPAGIWAGIRQAVGDIVLLTDVDQSTPLCELERLLPWHAQGYDVVIGSRGGVREGASFLRRAGSRVFRALRRSVILREISDTQCGFKSCRREAALAVFPRLRFLRRQAPPRGWRVSAYDVELLYLFRRAGYSVKEVAVAWHHRDRDETTRKAGDLTRYVGESIEMAREVLRVKLDQMLGFYDLPDE